MLRLFLKNHLYLMTGATERLLFSKDWITIVILIIFALFAIAKFLNSERFSSLFSLLYSRNYLVRYQKQSPLLINSFHISFAIIQILTFSIAIFISVKAFNTVARELEFSYFISILTGVFIIFVLRFFVGKLLAVVFDKEKEFEYITYLKLSYLSNFCLFIFPFLIFAIYAKYESTGFALFVLVFSSLLLLFYYGLIINNNQKLILKRLFYFILYLCALEIAPIILLYKLFIV